MHIKLDDLQSSEVAGLLQLYLDDMAKHSPPESVHALDLDELRQSHVSFWTAWENNSLAGCGALSKLDQSHGEIKSMRTANNFLRRGVAALLLEHILVQAKADGLQRVSLETGTPEVFKPARQLYARYGFQECAPFADYVEDPYSVYMTLRL